MRDVILILNTGSSSLKFALYGNNGANLEPLYKGQIGSIFAGPRFLVEDAIGKRVAEKTWPVNAALDQTEAIETVFSWCVAALSGQERIRAVGHRVVHGGMTYSRPMVVNADILADLDKFIPLAPLHQPHNLAAIHILAKRHPRILQVACFDTAFHTTIPIVAQTFALPRQYTERGIRRYGFHGLSYEYIASVLPDYDAQAAKGRTVVAHLGSGASLCAMEASKSVACTLGFSAADGLMMGTRCGTLDPGVLLYLMDADGLDARALERLIYQESGLLGVSGVSSDMRTLLESDAPQCAVAVALFVYRIKRELGSMVAALGGLDALVFTGGIGENASAIRAQVCNDAPWLGLILNETANRKGGPCISQKRSKIKAWVIPTDEEWMIGHHTLQALRGKAL